MAKPYQPIATALSHSLSEASRKSLKLYRAALKEAPNIIKSYSLGIPVTQVRSRINEEFSKHKGVKDTNVIDFLIFRGQIELEEIKEQWKTRPHILNYFTPPPKEKNQDLLKEFLDGEQND